MVIKSGTLRSFERLALKLTAWDEQHSESRMKINEFSLLQGARGVLLFSAVLRWVFLFVFVCFQVAELEVQSGQLGPSDGGTRDELTQSLEELEALLKAKDEVSTLFKGDFKINC